MTEFRRVLFRSVTMLIDHTISKPGTLRGYALHRLVQGLTSDKSALFVDMGDKILVRTQKGITTSGIPIRVCSFGDVLAFELRASVGRKRKGKHIYFPLADWRSRHEWLSRQGTLKGFEILSLHSSSSIAKIDDGNGRKFTLDQTDFVGEIGRAHV